MKAYGKMLQYFEQMLKTNEKSSEIDWTIGNLLETNGQMMKYILGHLSSKCVYLSL